MRALAIVLLLGVFLRHDASIWLAEGSRFSSAAVFFMLGGLWEVVLAAILFTVVWQSPNSRWQRLALVALGIAIAEALQMSVCRFFQAPRGINVCDSLTGLPVGAWTTGMSLFAVVWASGVFDGLILLAKRGLIWCWRKVKK